MMSTINPLLNIKNLSKHFGGIAAVDDVSFEMHRGCILGLIGPNGSGKTTLFNCLTGLIKSEQKSYINFLGSDITNLKPNRIARMGLTRTFQDARVFQQLTVLDNLLIAIQQYQEDNLINRFINLNNLHRYERLALDRASELLDFIGLSHHSKTLAKDLSYGQRKLLIFAMAVMPNPALVLLDEPAAAINPTAIENLKEYVVELNSKGISFLIIEHNMEVVMTICHRLVVLDHGEKIAEGSPEEIQTNGQVIDAYFGRE
jgi:ABC-type branched-subunit amino acid transport system ATPase component